MIHRFDAFVTGITTCYKYIQKIKSQEMTELGMKGTHAMCIFYLHMNPAGLTSAHLCALCAEDKAAISRTVSELRSGGYLLQEPGKNYRSRLRLSEKGEEIAEKAVALIGQWVCAGGDGLTEQQRTDFYDSLALISQNLKQNMDQHK